MIVCALLLQGRDGKGSIYVWAAGNGGRDDSCAADGYASSIYTIAMGAASSNGSQASYDEDCAGKMAVTFVSDSLNDTRHIVSLALFLQWWACTAYNLGGSISPSTQFQCIERTFSSIASSPAYDQKETWAYYTHTQLWYVPYLPSCYIYIRICISFFLQTTTVAHGRCTNDFEGTSAATPLAAGVFALMLEAKCVLLLNSPHSQPSPLYYYFLFFSLSFGECKIRTKKWGRSGNEAAAEYIACAEQLLHISNARMYVLIRHL